MNFYVCATPYHLFITLCHMLNKNKKSYIYLSTHDGNIYKLFLKYKKELIKLNNVVGVSVRKRGNIKERLFIESFIDKIEYKKLKEKISTSNVIIFPWNPYSLFSPSEYIFKYAKKVILIEEGANLYVMKKPSLVFTFIKKYIYRRNIFFYKEDKVFKIMVQFPERYPKHLCDKLENLKLKDMINNINAVDKQKVVEILSDGVDFNKFDKESVIILTQPLSEDGFISENKKIQLYKNIIDNYGKEYNIILKKHPRENTKYNFENVLELDGNFPSELFKLVDIRFKKAIGICTGAVNFIEADESFNIDEDFLKNLNNKR